MDPDSQFPQQGPTLSVGDVMYILFRHKWKIVLFTLLGLGAAAGVWSFKKPLFESNAKIWIRYVTERRAANAAGGATDVVREPEVRGLAVVNSEVEILTSVDSVLAAVRSIGPERVLRAYGGGDDEYNAAGKLLNRLKTTVGSSGVVTIELAHPEAGIAREALEKIIDAYRTTHLKVHRSSETYDELQAGADRIRGDLARTEEELRSAKSRVNVTSLDDTKQELSAQAGTLRSEIFAAEAQLAEKRAHLEIAEQRSVDLNPKHTNEIVAASSTTNYPASKIESYRMLASKLSILQKRETDLLLGSFSESSRYILNVRQQIEDTQKQIAELGVDPSNLDRLLPQLTQGEGQVGNTWVKDLEFLRVDVRGLEARINELTKQRLEILTQLKTIEESEATIRNLERRRAGYEEKLRNLETNLDKARVDQAIDASKLTNITVVQEPTPAGQNMKKIYKLVMGVFFGMAGAGVALAFVLELVFDSSLKRAKDVERKVGLPLFVTIPQFGTNGRPRLKMSRKALKDPALSDETGLVRKGEIVPWSPSDPMFEYYESLRDRVVMSYEGDPRKPKLVAVTSCNRGAGTTRVSTGLAAALSRDVQRRVLYIGLEKDKVAVTAFHKGRPESEIMPSDLVNDGSGEAVEPQLYTLAHAGYNPQGASIVQSFCDMIPRLRMSEYDYIIFDLPPVSETSGSLRLASQMERTLLVIESEETQKAKVDRVRDLLSGTGTRMFAVLNKTRSYGPRFLAEQT